MQYFVWPVLLLPLVGFVVNSLVRLPNRYVSWVGPGSVGLAFMSAVVAFGWLQGQPAAARHSDLFGWHWVLAGPFALNFGLLLDPLSSTMSLIITGVGFLILVYSIGYMHGESGYRRFFAQMDLFIFAMLLLVLADNYLWLLIGWAGVGLTSYLLIGYYYLRPSAVAAARKAFVMNVIGDWGMLIAIFMMFTLFHTVTFTGVFSRILTLKYDGAIVTAVALFLLVGAVAKSAQIPLYTWLPDAMEGPTPVSALIHAATMVTAGVYLIARSYPIFQQSPIALHTVAFVGAVGSLYAATMGLANNDIKRILAYSTMSQIAYMFVGVGVAVYSAGLFHLLEHAFFKALLFMGAGAVMHALHDVLDIRLMGGLRHKLRFTFWTFLAGVLAITGFPFFSGFFSKEDVIGAAYSRAVHGDAWLWIVWALVVVTAGVTAIYMLRLFFLVFFGEPRDRELYEGAHDPGLTMRIPMGILTVLSIFGGWLAFPGLWNLMDDWLSAVLSRYHVLGPAIGPQPFYWPSLAVTLAFTFAGYWVAWQIYYLRRPSAERVAAMAPSIYRLFLNKYYVDEIYDALFVGPVLFAGRMLGRYFEHDVIDATIDGVATLTGWLGSRLRSIQTGYVRNYALSILLGAVVVVVYYVFAGR